MLGHAFCLALAITSQTGGGWRFLGPVAQPIVAMSDPAKDALVVSVDPGELFRSTDQGRTWERADQSLPHGYGIVFSSIANDALDPRVLFLAVRKPFADWLVSEVDRSTDSGISWTRADDGLDGGIILAVVSTADGSGPILYTSGCAFDAVPAPCRHQSFLSRDRGDHWTQLTNSPADTAVLAARGAEVWAGGSGGLFRSMDEGETWTAASGGIEGCAVVALAFDPASPTVLYAGTGEGGARFVCGDVYRSVDAGMHWTAAGLGTDVTAIVAGRGRVLAGSFRGGFFYPPAGVFESVDGGKDWIDLEIPSGSAVPIAFGPGGRSIFAGTDSGLYRLPLAALKPAAPVQPIPITPRDPLR